MSDESKTKYEITAIAGPKNERKEVSAATIGIDSTNEIVTFFQDFMDKLKTEAEQNGWPEPEFVGMNRR